WEKYPLIFSDNKGFSVTDINSNHSKVYINGSLKSILPISENKLIAAFNSGIYFINYDKTSNDLSSEKHLVSCRAYSLCQEQGTKNVYASTSVGLYIIFDNGKSKKIKYKSKDINALAIYNSNQKTYISTRKNGVLVYNKGQKINQFFPK